LRSSSVISDNTFKSINEKELEESVSGSEIFSLEKKSCNNPTSRELTKQSNIQNKRKNNLVEENIDNMWRKTPQKDQHVAKEQKELKTNEESKSLKKKFKSRLKNRNKFNTSYEFLHEKLKMDFGKLSQKNSISEENNSVSDENHYLAVGTKESEVNATNISERNFQNISHSQNPKIK